MATTPNPNGNPDSFFVARVRRELRDAPKTFTDPFTGDGLRGGFAAGSQPYQLQRSPVINSSQESVPGAVCSVASTPTAVVYDVLTPAAAQVSVITETGELIFGTIPPANASILFTYQAALNGTQQILDALKEGLAAMWPEIYQLQTDTTTVVLTPTTTEYTLSAAFNDPRTHLLSVEVAPPSGIITYFDTGLWDETGPNNSILKMEQSWPPGSVCRLTFNAQYANLSDLEPMLLHLPVYYAIGRLLEEQETRRTRQADLTALTGEGGNKPGDAAKQADRWMNRFLALKQEFAQPDPSSTTVKDRSVERLPFARATSFSWNPFG